MAVDARHGLQTAAQYASTLAAVLDCGSMGHAGRRTAIRANDRAPRRAGAMQAGSRTVCIGTNMRRDACTYRRNDLMRITAASGTLFLDCVWRRLLARTDTCVLAGAAARRDHGYSLRGAFPSYCYRTRCPIAPKMLKLRANLTSLAAMGIGALFLQQLADFAVGSFLRGITPAQQIAHFARAAGLIYVALLFTFVCMPV
jgi:hypothetical protein